MGDFDKETIFVSIASYRDSEIIPTIRDLLENVFNSDRIIIGICLQDTDEIINNFPYKNHKNVRMYNMNYTEAKGVCYARYIIQTELYNNEKYYLQIDSHTRFVKNWDTILIEQLKECPSTKQILTTYPNAYERDDVNKNYLKNDKNMSICVKDFSEEGFLYVQGCRVINTISNQLWVAAGFIFTVGDWLDEVKYDNRLYFRGEEDSLTIRSFIFGWDLFCPLKATVYHCYESNLTGSTKKYRPLHWEEHRFNNNYNIVRDLYNGIFDNHTNTKPVRSIENFQLHMGINFKDNIIEKYANQGFCYKDKNIVTNFKLILQSNEVEIGVLWIITLYDENNEEKYRIDIAEKDIIYKQKNEIDICLNNSNLEINFKRCAIWPMFSDKTFGKRVFFPIRVSFLDRIIY